MATFRSCSLRAIITVLVTAALPVGAVAAPPRPAAVRVDDVSTLAGTWRGVVFGPGDSRDTWVEMTIQSDGSYEAVSYRQIGVFRSHGRIQVDGGQLRYASEKGRGVLVLVPDKNGATMLKLDGTLEPLGPITANLRPKAR